jgi:drug/metabolite transporter (DMT)-like permease
MSKTLIQAFGFMLLSTTFVVIGDSGSKLLSQQGFSPFFVGWSRFALGAIIVLPFSGLMRQELRFLLDWRVILRAALIAGAICSILMALLTEPLANAFGGFFVGPIVSYILSALLLKEAISWRRSLLLGVSFIGVLVVVRPGFGMTTGMGFAVLAGCFHGCYLVSTRWLIGHYRPRFLIISQLIIGAVILSPFSSFAAPSFTLETNGLILVSALGSALGNLVLLLANRKAAASVIAPLVYLQLLTGTVIGYIVFNDWPDKISMIGLSIILTAGLSSLWLAGRGK